MMHTKKVNVLLPVYNGEKYLREQLDCLLNQTYNNLDIYVRDDGSSDATMCIIDEYAQKDPENFRFHIIPNNGVNLGYPDCFWELMKVAEPADYYSFCDQDDYWYSDKIESAIKLIESAEDKLGENIPIMSFCNFDYCDENMNFVRKNDTYSNIQELKFYNGMYYTYAPGFTQVINRAMVENVQLNQLFGHKLAHDLWCQWIASAYGKVLYDPEIRAHYRRHGSAVTAANISKIKSLKLWWEKEIKGNQIVEWKNSLSYFNDLFNNRINKETRRELELFATKSKSPNIKLKKLFFNHKLRPSIGGDLALRVLILKGKC